MCYVRAYLRASTSEQDASRARGQLEAFAAERNLEVVSWYVENESGASLQRPELFRLLADAKCGDILLVEQVDRLSRLTTDDWEALKAKLAEKRIRVVAIDLPTSWIMGGQGSRRLHQPAVRCHQRHAARYAGRHCPQGLRRPATPAGARDREGEDGGPLQGSRRGYRAQRGHHSHARGRPVLERDTGSDRLQPLHHCAACQERRRIDRRSKRVSPMHAAPSAGLSLRGGSS